MFPTLRTGVIAQYPIERRTATATETVRFLGGEVQSYRLSAQPRRRWRVRLDRLDSSELAELRAFFQQQKGRWGAFTFTDPATGVGCASCSFESDVFPAAEEGEGRLSAELSVYEHA